MEEGYPCNSCSDVDHCGIWDEQFCCRLCLWYGADICENCAPIDM